MLYYAFNVNLWPRKYLNLIVLVSYTGMDKYLLTELTLAELSTLDTIYIWIEDVSKCLPHVYNNQGRALDVRIINWILIIDNWFLLPFFNATKCKLQQYEIHLIIYCRRLCEWIFAECYFEEKKLESEYLAILWDSNCLLVW